MVGIVRWGRNWEGLLRSVCTARLKARRLVFGGFGIFVYFSFSFFYLLGVVFLVKWWDQIKYRKN